MNFKRKLETAIALILISSMAISFQALSTTNAQTTYNYDAATLAAKNAGMFWDINYNASATRLLLWNRFHDQIPTYVYLMAAPNPVGVNEPFNLVMFQPQVPPDALMTNNIRYQYTLKITNPDGTTQTLPANGGTYTSDSTGSQYTQYTSSQIGNLSATVTFQKLFYNWNDSNTQRNYYGTTFLESTYTLPIVVQQQRSDLIDLPLIQDKPTEYWARPIEGQNTYWANYASNWLNNGHDNDNGGSENRFQEDGTAPNSGHILWTRPTEDNGIVGGSVGRFGNVFNAGSQYQPRLNNMVIMYGRLYYTPNVWYQGTSELMDIVDLKTGELLNEVNTTGVGQFSFGYQYSFDDPNEHGIVNPGYIFTSNYARAYHPERGIVSAFNISNVPSGFEVNGPAGENVRFVLTNLGSSANPNYYLAQWNSSRVIPNRGNPTSARIPGNVPITPANPGGQYWNGSMWVSSTVRTAQGIASATDTSYDWNVTFPIKFTNNPTVRAAVLGDILFGSNGSWPTGTSGPSFAYPDEVTVWAVSLKPASLGQLIYMKNLKIDNAATNTNNMIERASGPAGVFVTIEIPIQKFHVYSIRTGEQLFETDAQSDFSPYGYFTWPSLISETQTKLAYGMLYTGGYTGSVSAYNLTSGKLQWRQTAPSGGAKIQNYVLMLGLEADGKIYVGTHEHSADTPLYKGEHVRVYDAYTGDVVWQMAGWAYPMTFATADGVLIYWNNYDAQLYAIGKGPSATTVTASPKIFANGENVLIEGSVIDVSAGTKQQEQAARFPYGVPAVSDASQSEWMEYVYMQKGRPTNTVGVNVKLSIIDPNGNGHELTATSDSLGQYSIMWTPPVPGKYTVIAQFQGSESYWPSMAETAFGVGEAPSIAPIATATPTPAPATPTPTATATPTTAPSPKGGIAIETYIAIAAVVIIAIVAAAALILRRRK